MTAPNLTRDQAAARRDVLHDVAYRIDLDLTDGAGQPGETTFSSTTTITFGAQAGSSTFVDLVAPRLISATLNGTELSVDGYDEEVGLTLPDLAARNELVVVADCAYSNTGEGLHRFVDPADGAVYLYSQFETADAKRMFACFDQPDIKATFDVTVTAPAHWQVISNGAPVSAERGDLDDTTVHTFATTPRMSTYLVALIAGYSRRISGEADRQHSLALDRLGRQAHQQFRESAGVPGAGPQLCGTLI